MITTRPRHGREQGPHHRPNSLAALGGGGDNGSRDPSERAKVRQNLDHRRFVGVGEQRVDVGHNRWTVEGRDDEVQEADAVLLDARDDEGKKLAHEYLSRSEEAAPRLATDEPGEHGREEEESHEVGVGNELPDQASDVTNVSASGPVG